MTQPHKRPLQDEDALNLDSLSFEELGRAPICQENSEKDVADPAPDLSSSPECRQRESEDRELLGNQFPDDQ